MGKKIEIYFIGIVVIFVFVNFSPIKWLIHGAVTEELASSTEQIIVFDPNGTPFHTPILQFLKTELQNNDEFVYIKFVRSYDENGFPIFLGKKKDVIMIAE